MKFAPLTPTAIEAVRILARHRDRPMTGKKTSEAAVNYTTAWGLQDRGLAYCSWWNGCERVKLYPATRTLLEARP